MRFSTKMRRLSLMAWPLIFYFCIVLAAVATESDKGDNIRLRVAVQEDTLRGVPSCQLTFSRIELINLHTTDTIFIHSVQTAPEETVLIRSASGEKVGSTWNDEVIPQQLHVSRLPQGISLGPGQAAIVPLSFLPRYPDIGFGIEHDSELNRPPALSSIAEVDLRDLVGESAMDRINSKAYNKLLGSASYQSRRNNLGSSLLPQGEEYEVKTTVVIETTRGMIKLPLAASSVRENSYSAPDTIQFRQPEYESKLNVDDRMIAKSSPSKRPPTTPAAILLDTVNFNDDGENSDTSMFNPPGPQRDCYDLFLSNPSPSEELEISEVLISSPELISVEFDPQRLLLSPDRIVFPTEPSHAIRQWTEEGPIYLPPDSVDNYVATVCTVMDGALHHEEDSGIHLEEMGIRIESASSDRGLGFLQVRTSDETLFMGLERIGDEKISIQNSSPALNAEPATSDQTSESTTLLKATPERIAFHFMSSQSQTMVAKIGLQNKSPAPIRIMRMTAGLSTGSSPGVLASAELVGLRISGSLETADPSSESFVLEPADDFPGTVVISCKIERSIAGLPIDSLHFTGTIIIRGTMDTDHSFARWREEMMQNPHHDMHLVLEIPFTVSVVNGRIDVMIERSTHPYPQIFSAQPWDESGRVISALFFPLSRLEALDGSENPLPTQSYQGAEEIGHDLLIASNKAMPLKLEGAEVVGEEGDARAKSLCNRFNVSVTSPFETSSESVNGSEQIGYLSLHYKFNEEKADERRRKMRDRDDTDHVYATTCYLNVITSPIDAGMHRVPLIIFSGHLEVSTPNSISDSSSGMNSQDKAETENGPKATGMSFLRMLSWLRSSVVGKSLLEVLGSIGEEKGSKSFRKFLRTICRHSPKLEDSKLKPILLKIGAIEHSEIARTPLFLTNHNPVPITVEIDVGEVEGMSITVGRDASQGPGDGNNMLDYFPKSYGLRREVNSGRHQGQPLEGLRQFLLSNDKALSFSARFPFRDAVSLNKAAVARQPLLRSLYKLHSNVKFHREQLPKRSKSVETTCESSPYPPLYNSFESQTSEHYDTHLRGPIIVSGDKTLVRPLEVKWEKNTSDPTTGSSVLIPPGATARFEVRVRAPPAAYLSNDISQVLATGLLLSTNFGHLMPIFATFEALQGQLHVSHVGTVLPLEEDAPRIVTTSTEEGVDIIGVPLGLYWKSPEVEAGRDKASLSIPPAHTESLPRSMPEVIRNNTASNTDHGISLHMSSTFSREVRLLQVESCNPWFRFVLRDSDGGYGTRSDLGINIGHLYSTVSCTAGRDVEVAYPSYYQCALNWLTNRSDLQPSGCGRLPVFQKRKSDDEAGADATHRGVGRVRNAFERVLSLLEEAYSPENHMMKSNETATLLEKISFPTRNLIAIKSGRKRSNGIVPLPLLNAFAEASDAWRVAANFGLGVLSSNLRATIEYETFSGETSSRTTTANRQSLSLSMHNLAIESVLTTPRLFHSGFGSGVPQLASDTDTPSVVEFPPTLVGAIASAKISLRNPTSVPVRVRLGASPSFNNSSGNVEHSADESIRKRFLQNLGAPYVQNGLSDSADDGSPHHLWWNGGGSFYMGDGRGDFIRSNHNITIKAGVGAQVTLANPSLHANTAFVVGCGVRCGIRAANMKKSKDYNGPELSSPIGAAAASGITLLGRKRYPLPPVNPMAMDEPNVLAGGVAGDSGPPAFAIPYLALDEIVIPPYGVAEVGPIYFRPPGRFGVLGCDLARESEATHWGLQTGELCKEEIFESMIFLENSLTGLERLVLRGKSLHERLYFLDPLPEDGEDAFGDIEFRSGRSTLVFPGSSETRSSHYRTEGKGPDSVIKEVLLQNGGDVAIEIEVIYLSDNSKVQDKRWPSSGVTPVACTFGSFRLFDCWESNQLKFNVDGGSFENIHAGLELLPGENRSLFMEHIPVCTKQDEFISLNIEYTHGISSSISRSGETGNSRLKKRSKGQRKKIDLTVGYQMSAAELTSCVPVDGGTYNSVVRPNIVASSHGNNTDSVVGTKASHEFKFRGESTASIGSGYEGTLARLCDCFVLLAAFTLLAFSWTTMPQAIEIVWFKFHQSAGPSEKMKSTSTKSMPTSNSRWFPLFRCLARADPTSAELQALGREQTRQVIISRYRAKGIIPPQSVNNPGFLSRDRISNVANTSPHRAGKEAVAGNERARTLSDALFQNVSAEETESSRVLLPLGLGWRTAFSRGIIGESSIEANALHLKTRNLMLTRRGATEPELEMEDSLNRDEYREYEPEEDSYEGEPEVDSSEEDVTAGDDTSEDISLDNTTVDDEATEEQLSIVDEPEQAQTLQDKTREKQSKHEHVDVSNDMPNPDQDEKQSQRESCKLRQDAETGKPKSKRDNEVDRQKIGASNDDISAPESLQHDSGGKKAGHKEHQRVAKASTNTNPTDTKNNSNPNTGEGRNTNKRNGREVDYKDPSKLVSNTNTTKADAKTSNGKQSGNRQDEGVVQQTSQKATSREKGKSQNQQKRGSRVLQKGAADASNHLRQEKGPKSERGKGTAKSTNKANSENSSKKKGKNKSSKNRSQAMSDKPTPTPTSQPRQSGLSVTEPGNVAEKSSSAAFRPPPGLAPPPGFLGEDPQSEVSSTIASTPQTDLGPMLSSLLPHPDLGLAGSSQSPALSFLQPISGRHDLLFTAHDSSIAADAESAFPVHGSQNMSRLAQSSGPSQTQPSGFVDQLNAAMNPPPSERLNDGFDVMDFLDSILNESTQEQVAQTHDTGAVLLPGSSPILSNPWASEGQSRALAYGISFDRSEGDVSVEAESPILNVRAAVPVEQQGIVGNIPLLTPAAILFSDQERQREMQELTTKKV